MTLRTRGGIAAAFLVALTALTVVAAGAFYVAQRSGWLAGRVAALASSPDMQIRIGRLSGLPFAAQLSDITVADRDGIWLTIQRAEADWRLKPLLQRRLEIPLAAARGVTVLRQPRPSDERQPGGPVTLPTLPVAIDLQTLRVERLALQDAVLGVAAAAELEGRFAVKPGWRDLALHLSVRRTDGEGRFELTAASPSDSRRLDLALNYAEPPGGLAARLAALPGLPALQLTVDGAGTIESWQGRVQGEAEGLASIDLTLQLGAVERLRATLDGSAMIAALLPENLRSLAEPAVRLNGGLVQEPDGRLRLEAMTVAVPAGHLALEGAVLPQLDLGIRLGLPDLEPLSLAAGRPVFGRIAAVGRATGTADAPAVQLDLEAGDLSSAGARTATLEAHVEAALGPAGWRLATTGTAIDLTSPGAPPVPRLTWDIAAAQADEAIEIAHAAIDAGLAQARVAGRIEPNGRVGGRLQVEAENLAPLAALAGARAAGRGRIDGTAEGSLADGLSADLALQFDGLALGQPILDALLQGRLDGKLQLRHDAAGTTRIEQAQLSGSAIHLQASGNLQPEALDLRVAAQLPRLAALSRPLGTPLAGAVSAKGTVGGSLTAPTGRLALQGRVNDLQPRASARFASDGAVLSLQDLSAAIAGVEATGNARIRIDGPAVDGTLTLRGNDLAPLSRLAGFALAGSVAGELKLAHGLQGQTAELRLEGRNLAADTLRLARLDTRATLQDLLGKPRGNLQLRAGDLSSGQLRVANAELQAEGALANTQIKLDARGQAAHPFRVAAAGTLSREAAATRLTLRSLNGNYGNAPIALRGQTTLVQAADGIELAETVLGIAGGSIVARADTRGGKLQAGLELRALPAGLARLANPALDLAGQLDGRLLVTGTTAQPAGDATLRVRGFGRRTDALTHRLNGDLQGRWRDGRVALEGGIGGLGREPLRLTGSLPLAWRPEGGPLLPPDGRIEARATGALDVARLLILTGLDQPASGSARVDLTVGGTIGQPDVRGAVEMADGKFANPDVGLVLERIAFKLTGDGNRLQLASLTAGDGAGGRLSGEGQLDLRGENMPFHGRLGLTGFTFRPPQGTVRTQASLTVGGDMRRAAIEGQVTVDRGELVLPEKLPADIVRIEVVEVNGPQAGNSGTAGDRRADAGTGGKPPPPMVLRLGVDVSVPGRVFVRGRGLESEWSGRLRIGGTTAAPDVDGNLTLVRGRFDFLGRTLTLTEGRMDFPGGSPEPYVTITATVPLDGVQATVGVTGRASAPRLTVTSSPSLPQDEILARMLFGRRLDQLSTAQAIQLAAAVQTLTGGTGGGIVASIRAKTGLDVIDVTQSEGKGSPNLRVGKYLNDKTFLKVEQGLTAESSKVGVEVELNDRFSVQTDLGAKTGGGVGLNWKMDY